LFPQTTKNTPNPTNIQTTQPTIPCPNGQNRESFAKRQLRMNLRLCAGRITSQRPVLLPPAKLLLMSPDFYHGDRHAGTQ
ncbi:hypothetical protein, partial [Rhizobium herbae]|uniref:hypothetical protein n=1 Tax=Rhizobium herbae TaxID=508661 RepID=UPI001AE56D48